MISLISKIILTVALGSKVKLYKDSRDGPLRASWASRRIHYKWNGPFVAPGHSGQGFFGPEDLRMTTEKSHPEGALILFMQH